MSLQILDFFQHFIRARLPATDIARSKNPNGKRSRIKLALILAMALAPQAAMAYDWQSPSINYAYVADGRCVAGTYANDTTAPVKIQWTAYNSDAGPGRAIGLVGWNPQASQIFGVANYTSAPIGQLPTQTTTYCVGNASLLGTGNKFFYVGLRDSWNDVSSWSDNRSPLLSADVPANTNGGTAAYTGIDMSLDPDCVAPDIGYTVGGSAFQNGTVISLSDLPVGQTRSITFRIVNDGGSNLTSTSAPSSANVTNLNSVSLTGGSSFSLKNTTYYEGAVNYQAAASGAFSFDLVFPSNDPDEPNFYIRYTGTAVDATAPSIQSISRYSPSVATTADDSLTFEVEFSEPVTGVGPEDFAVTGVTSGTTTVAAVSTSLYRVTISGGNLANLDGTVSLSEAVSPSVADLAGNALATGSLSASYTVANPPTVTISALSGPTAGKYTATITLSEASTNFVVGDLTLVNATATMSGSGTSYTVTLTPAADGTLSVTVPAGAFTDSAGNANTASNAASTSYVSEVPLTLVPEDGWTLRRPAFAPIDQIFVASGGTAPYTYTLSGTLPKGVHFDAAQGRLSGEARESGRFPFTVAVTDGDGKQARRKADKLVNTCALVVSRLATSITLKASADKVLLGTSVRVTASVGPETASGSVVFSIDGVEQPIPVTLSGGKVIFTTDALAIGEHKIVARYRGDTAHAAANSETLRLVVLAPGSVVIRQRTDGTDGAFAFSSSTRALNMVIQTQGGLGESAAVSLAAGTYTVSASDMRAEGFAFTSITCTDDKSHGEIGSRTAVIRLAPGAKVTCTFSSVNAREKTTELIEDFLTRRADMILTSLPDSQRRIDRLKGVAPTMDDPLSSLKSYLPGLLEGGQASISTSLGAIDALAGEKTQRLYDAWF